MVQIDYTKDELLSEAAKVMLKERYLIEGEDSPQDAFARVASYYGDDEAHAQRLYDYASNLWFGFATPVLSNGGTKRGLPISCFLNELDDSREGIADNYSDTIWLASMGGGIGSNWSRIRSEGSGTSQGSKSTGMIPFMHVVDRLILAVNQSVTRRGGYASYLDISHPEISEFLSMRIPKGDPNRKNLNLHHGINIPDSFMKLVEAKMKDKDFDDSWDLIDPHTKEVTETVKASDLWEQILKTRFETGEPYLHFIDASNRHRPQAYKDAGLEISQSNLCSEILIPTDPETTAVCCLSSVNLEKYDEWKDTDMVKDLIRMLDNVLQDFIDNAPETMSKAVKGAIRGRDIGLGAMGFHAYLQSKGVPFESALASSYNRNIFKDIKEKATEATRELAIERGPCPIEEDTILINEQLTGKRKTLYGDTPTFTLNHKEGNTYSITETTKYMQRNVQLLAIAPNASSGIICGTSPSIEPFSTNLVGQKTLNGTTIVRNKFLELTEEQWVEVSSAQGSILGIDIDEYKKDTFKTAFEIDQHWVIEHAAARQEYICQSQSVNLFFPSDASVEYMHSVHFSAWKKGLKTLYYCRTMVQNRADNISLKFDRHSYSSGDNECLSCEG